MATRVIYKNCCDVLNFQNLFKRKVYIFIFNFKNIMEKKSLIALACFLFILLNLSLVSSQEVYKAIHEGDRIFVATDNRVGVLETNEGKILWEYKDEAQISGMELIDWNSDGEKDLVLSTDSAIIPPIKIIDGKTGKILQGFYPKEKTYAGNVLMPAQHLKVIGSDIIFSSGLLLYKIEQGQVKRINLLKRNIERIESESGMIKLFSVIKLNQDTGHYTYEKVSVDLKGKIMDKEKIEYTSSDFFRNLRQSNCQENNFNLKDSDTFTVADISLNSQDEFYCLNDFIYYINESNFLLKRNLNTKTDTPLREIKCSNPQILGETVLCYEGFDLKNGKKVPWLEYNENEFFTFYNGEKELIIENNWPFNYKFGDTEGNFNFEVLNDSLIYDSFQEWDYDGNGKKEILLSFREGYGRTSALMFFESFTGQKKLITLKLNEQQIKDKNKSLQNNLTNTERNLNRTQEEINKKRNRIDGLHKKRSEITNESNIREVDKEISDLEDDVSDLHKETQEFNNEIERIRQDLYDLRRNSEIKSFDFCNGKLFVVDSYGDVYLFEDGKDAKKIDFDRSSLQYIACFGDEKLVAFSYERIFITEQDGTPIKEKNLSEKQTPIATEGAVRIKDGEKIYLYGTDEENNYIFIYDSDGDLIKRGGVGELRATVKEGKPLFCSESYSHKDDDFTDVRLLDKGISNYKISGLSCRKIVTGDCDNDGKNEVILFEKSEDKLTRICYNGGNRNVSYSDVEGRLVGDYFIVKSDDGNYRFGDYNLQFPYEVYNKEGEKILVSLKHVFLKSGGFVDYEGKEITATDFELIQSKEIDENEVFINFKHLGEKIIFVNGTYYDIVEDKETILKLTSGKHVIQAYFYNLTSEGISFDKEEVTIPSSNSISFLSWIILIVFIVIIPIIIIIKKKSE